jgi:hypothetical protein
MPRAAIPTVLAAVIAAAVGGCGGSTPPTPNFAAIADTICTNADLAIAALPAEGSSLTSLTAAAGRELLIVRTELTQLSALTAPSSETTEFASALSATRSEVSIVAGLVSAVRSGDTSRVVTLAIDGNRTDALAKTAMTALHLGDCAREAVPRGQG